MIDSLVEQNEIEQWKQGRFSAHKVNKIYSQFPDLSNYARIDDFSQNFIMLASLDMILLHLIFVWKTSYFPVQKYVYLLRK